MTLGRKFISIITLTFVVFALSTVSFGQETPAPTDKSDAVKKDGKRGKHGRKGKRGRGGRKGMRGRGGRRGGGALRGITLNDSQKQQLQTLFQSNRGNRRSGGNDEARNLMRLKRSGLATSAQEAQLKGITEKRRSERAVARTKMDQSIRSILTAEQQQQYDKNLAERKQKMEGRKNMHRERKNSQPSKNN